MLANVLLLFVRPEGVGLGWVVVLLVSNAFVFVESLLFAAPVHYRMDREGQDAGAIRGLIRLNALRLAASAASSAVVLYLLVAALTV